MEILFEDFDIVDKRQMHVQYVFVILAVRGFITLTSTDTSKS